MKILLLNIQFERGGAARVAAILCNELEKKGHEIILVTDWKNWNNNYVISPSIKIREISTKGENESNFLKLKKWLKCSLMIRKYIHEEKPDIIIATESMMFLCAWLGNIGSKVPIIAADHTSFNRKIDPIIDFVRYHLYSKAEGLTILTYKDYKLLGNKFPKKRVIYNPIDFNFDSTTKISRRKNILCAGRLEVWKLKGFDIILEIWNNLNKKYPDWILEIAGASNDRETLETISKLINRYQLSSRVRLLGHVDDMQSLFRETSIFALPSRMEGFPMVMLEAMSQGCACIAFDVNGAATEMMPYGEGIIIEDGDDISFEKELENLIVNENLRIELSQKGIKRAKDFSPETFIKIWQDYIEETIKNQI